MGYQMSLGIALFVCEFADQGHLTVASNNQSLVLQSGIRHDLLQPINIILLASANIGTRLLPLLDEENATYLTLKLDRIERQIKRMEEMLNAIVVEPES